VFPHIKSAKRALRVKILPQTIELLSSSGVNNSGRLRGVAIPGVESKGKLTTQIKVQ